MLTIYLIFFMWTNTSVRIAIIGSAIFHQTTQKTSPPSLDFGYYFTHYLLIICLSIKSLTSSSVGSLIS
jgi:hypothetical protein